MAELKVIWTETAVLQRNLIFEYWNNRNRNNSYSKKLRIAIKERIHLLKQNPEMGKQTDFKKIRIIIFERYSILYKVEKEKIFIVSLWDNRQNPKKLLHLLRENK